MSAPIRWTSNTEAVQLPATPEAIAAAKSEAIDRLGELNEHKAWRALVIQALDVNEARLQLALKAALARARSAQVTLLAIVGFDLETFEQVLADPATRQELRRRPMTETERAAEDIR